MSENSYTSRVPHTEPRAQRCIRDAGGRGTHDGKNVIVAGQRRDVPRARGRNVLTPRPGLAIDHAGAGSEENQAQGRYEEISGSYDQRMCDGSDRLAGPSLFLES